MLSQPHLGEPTETRSFYPSQYGSSGSGGRMGKPFYKGDVLKTSEDGKWLSFLCYLLESNGPSADLGELYQVFLDKNASLEVKLDSVGIGGILPRWVILKIQQLLKFETLNEITGIQKDVLIVIVNSRRDVHNQLTQESDLGQDVLTCEWDWIRFNFEEFLRNQREILRGIISRNREGWSNLVTMQELEIERGKGGGGQRVKSSKPGFSSKVEWERDKNFKNFILNQLNAPQKEALGVFVDFVQSGFSRRRAFGLLSIEQKMNIRQILNIINSSFRTDVSVRKKNKKKGERRRNLKSRDPFAFAERQRQFYEVDLNETQYCEPSEARGVDSVLCQLGVGEFGLPENRAA